MSHKQGKGQIYVLEYLKAGYQTEKDDECDPVIVHNSGSGFCCKWSEQCGHGYEWNGLFFWKSRDQRLCVVYAERGWRRRADPENIGMCKGLQHGKMYLGNEWRYHISGRKTEGKE